MRFKTDVLIVGAGPAGVAGAVRARESGADVTLVDDNVAVGGQIWRGARSRIETAARKWNEKLDRADVHKLLGAQAIGPGPNPRTLLVENERETTQIEFRKLILATGARELFLPFPGWTLPGVTGVGGLAALAESGLPLSGKRVVVAGSGPLLLAVGAHLQNRGACVELIAEQAMTAKMAYFLARLWSRPRELAQAIGLRGALFGVPFRSGCWVVAAEGKDRVKRVHLRSGGRQWTEKCDYLAIAFGLIPNIELPTAFGCRVSSRGVAVDEFQGSSVDGVYCAGECNGIGGLDQALVAGEIAGFAAAGRTDAARRLFARMARAKRFARLLEGSFELRDELRELARSETIVCRCEDARLGEIKRFDSFRAAKLHTRCGMGPCQARICGPAMQFICGWAVEPARLPVLPARVGSLARGLIETEGQ